MTNPYKQPTPKRRKATDQPRRPLYDPRQRESGEASREKPIERTPAGGGYRILRRPRLIDEE